MAEKGITLDENALESLLRSTLLRGEGIGTAEASTACFGVHTLKDGTPMEQKLVEMREDAIRDMKRVALARSRSGGGGRGGGRVSESTKVVRNGVVKL